MNQIELHKTTVEGIYCGTVKHSSDDRGSYSKVFSNKIYQELGYDFSAKEFAVVFSNKGFKRGLHFSEGAMGEHFAKIAYCVTGKLLAAGLDIRKNSPTFGQYEIIELSPKNNRFIYLQEGVAFGTYALEDSALAYITGGDYGEQNGVQKQYADPLVEIDWQRKPFQCAF